MSREPKKTIGLILPSIVANFRDALLDSLSKHFYEKGYKLILGITTHDIQKEVEYLEYFHSVTDCIIINSEAEKFSEIESAITGEVPVLFLLNKPEGCPYTCILESDYSAIYQAIVSCSTKDEIKVGCVCADRRLSSTKEFIRAYTDAVNASPVEFDENLIVDVAGLQVFNARDIVLDMAYKGCRAILAATPAITSRILDYLVFYNTNPSNEPIALFGYGAFGSKLSSQMHIDVIMHPTRQIVDLAIQQAIYLINHPDFDQHQDFLIKGALRMHTYDGLHVERD